MSEPKPRSRPRATSFRLHPEEHAIIAALAAQMGISGADVVRLALRDLGRRQLGSVPAKGGER